MEAYKASEPKIPISLLTGFLGSGKTTVLNYLLRQPAMANVMVIINEFGEIGLDHELVESATDDLVLLQSGCLCCTIRGDLIETLQTLFSRRSRSEIPAFDRVVIETTGLADPAPILQAIMSDGLVMRRFQLDGVIATVDAVAGGPTLDRHIEAIKQAAVADRILLTKTDIAPEDESHAVEPACERSIRQRRSSASVAARSIRVSYSTSASIILPPRALTCSAGCRKKNIGRSTITSIAGTRIKRSMPAMTSTVTTITSGQ